MSASRLDILKESRLKKKKRARVRRIVQAVLLSFLFLGFIALIRSPLFRVSQIEVRGLSSEGAHKISEEVKLNLTGNVYFLLPKSNTFLVSGDKITGHLKEKFSSLGHVEIMRPGLNKLIVEVGERKTKALWCLPKIQADKVSSSTESLPLPEPKCYFIDEEGIAYAAAPNFSDELYLELEGPLPSEPVGKKIIESANFDRLLSFLNKLPEILKNYPQVATSTWLVDKAVSENLGDFRVSIKKEGSVEAFKVLFNLSQDPNELSANLNSVITSKDFRNDLKTASSSLDYLDLRFDKKIFYRFKGY